MTAANKQPRKRKPPAATDKRYDHPVEMQADYETGESLDCYCIGWLNDTLTKGHNQCHELNST